VVNLPAAAAGQTVQLRWRLATDSSVPGVGQRIDSLTIEDGAACSREPFVFTDRLYLPEFVR
jgi:hypothetical protein